MCHSLYRHGTWSLVWISAKAVRKCLCSELWSLSDDIMRHFEHNRKKVHLSKWIFQSQWIQKKDKRAREIEWKSANEKFWVDRMICSILQAIQFFFHGFAWKQSWTQTSQEPLKLSKSSVNAYIKSVKRKHIVWKSTFAPKKISYWLFQKAK